METVTVPHPNLEYNDRKHYSEFIGFDWSKATKQDVVHFARAVGYQETGMSVNEVALLYDILEAKKPRQIVELGRNYGCSTRLFLQHVLRHGGNLQSWDLRQWGNLKDSFAEMGFRIGPSITTQNDDDYTISAPNAGPYLATIRIAHSIKTAIPEDFAVDFLLVDTEHGIEHALGEYMRWREYLRSGSVVAFHDSDVVGVKRALEMIHEIEKAAAGDRFAKEYVNERIDGFGVYALEWKG